MGFPDHSTDPGLGLVVGQAIWGRGLTFISVILGFPQTVRRYNQIRENGSCLLVCTIMAQWYLPQGNIGVVIWASSPSRHTADRRFRYHRNFGSRLVWKD